MDKIYLLCVMKEKIEGGVDYLPIAMPTEDGIDLVTSTNLIEIQKENIDLIRTISDSEDVVVVDVPLETYRNLVEELNGYTAKIEESVEKALDALSEAAKILGSKIDREAEKARLMASLDSKYGGKCLNEDLEIVDPSEYITYDEYEYDEDDYDEDEDFDDDYDDEDYYDDDEEEEEDDDEYEDDDDDNDCHCDGHCHCQ